VRGGGVPVLKHPLDGIVVLRGGCAQAAGVGIGKGRGCGGEGVHFIGDVVGSGRRATCSTTRR
jgi:hypothetical protein